MADHDLLMEVSMAAANEKERLAKFNEEKPVVGKVNKLTCDSDDSEDDAVALPCNGSSGNHKSTKSKKSKNNKQKTSHTTNTHPHNTQADPMMAEVSKMATALQELSSSNAKLTAEVNALKGQWASSNKPKPPQQGVSPGFPFVPNAVQGENPVVQGSPIAGGNPLNPTALPFGQSCMNATGRVVYKCPTCVARHAPFCNHCFQCGSDQHKVRDGVCPVVGN